MHIARIFNLCCFSFDFAFLLRTNYSQLPLVLICITHIFIKIFYLASLQSQKLHNTSASQVLLDFQSLTSGSNKYGAISPLIANT